MTWTRFKAKYRAASGVLRCYACGSTRSVDLHHIEPISAAPSRIYDVTNVIPLCRFHHLHIGHLGNWSLYNPNVLADADRIRNKTTKFVAP